MRVSGAEWDCCWLAAAGWIARYSHAIVPVTITIRGDRGSQLVQQPQQPQQHLQEPFEWSDLVGSHHMSRICIYDVVELATRLRVVTHISVVRNYALSTTFVVHDDF
jgi:hypothetical protein